MVLATAFGLGIQSSLPLPELIPGATAVDVVVRFGKLEPPPPERHSGIYFARIAQREAYFYWDHAGAFLVREGREVVVDPDPSAEEPILRLYLLGSVLAALMHQRGCLVLHASAVAVDGGGVAFLGASGWGKSPLAAALHRRGHPLIADDLVALSPIESAGGPVVFPGFPRVKLWPDVLRALGEDPEALQRAHPLEEKRTHQAVDGFSLKALPIRRIYVLAGGPMPRIDRLGPQEALVELIRHTSRIELFPAAKAPLHMRQCADLVNRIPICRLTVPRCLDLLPELACLVEEDLRANSPHMERLHAGPSEAVTA